MPKIQILPESLINKIAAGEVVERPASVVKELVENSIDAGSDQIFVTIKNGGKDYISVLDNGNGMTAEDAQLSIERHATSKIINNEDLENINTMGFRGEALAAIAAVSRFELTTCGDEETGGYQVRVEGGKLTHSARMGFPKGTRITIENLFFNTPARQKFMKSVNTEYSHIHNLIIRLALGNPDIQFRLTHNKNLVLNIPKNQNFRQRIQDCFGSEISDDLVECEYEESYLSFKGLISYPSKSRSSKRWQHTFVNNRYVKNKTINHAVYAGYRTLLMKNIHPMFFIKVDLSPKEIDVNVHPAKTEIRLRNPNLIHTIFSEQISRLLKTNNRKQFFNPENNPSTSEDVEPISTTENRISPDQEGQPFPEVFVETNEQLGFQSSPSQKIERPSSTKRTEATKSDESEQTISNPFSFSGQPDAEPDTLSPVHLLAQDYNYQIIGQLLNKYIIAQGEKSMVLIDQHAAHERIRFEEIRSRFYAKTLDTQPLLIPVIMELPPQDGLLLEQHQESLEKMGFVIDHFGGNDYSIKEIPTILQDCDAQNLIKDILDEVAQFGKSGKMEDIYDNIFERMACHSAIRASQPLSTQEMQALLNQLAAMNIPLYCPHGRPILIEFNINDLDKKFKRA